MGKVNTEQSKEDVKGVFLKYLVYLLTGFAVIFGIGELIFFWDLYPGTRNSVEAWGVIGDYFGGTLNPILQFVVIVMLFWSMHIQTKELEETRKELKESRKANQLSADALQKQAQFQRTQLELNTIEKLLDISFNKLDKLAEEKYFNLSYRDKTHIDEGLSINDIVKKIALNGMYSILEVKLEYFNQEIAESVARSSQTLLVEQLELLQNYAKEKGSIYYVEYWIKKIIPYIQLFNKFPGVAKYDCVGKFRDIESPILNNLEMNNSDTSRLTNIFNQIKH